MNYDVSAVLDRSYEIWCCKCAVDHKWNLVCVSDICNCLDIWNLWVRISKDLNVEGLCVLLDSILKCLWIKWINECCIYIVILECMCKEIVCSAVDILCCYDVVSCKCKVLNCVCNCCCAWANCQCCNATLEGRDSSLKYILCWICKSSVDVAGILECESVSCMLWVVEYEWWCLVDWYRSCIRNRVCCLLSYV